MHDEDSSIFGSRIDTFFLGQKWKDKNVILNCHFNYDREASKQIMSKKIKHERTRKNCWQTR